MYKYNLNNDFNINELDEEVKKFRDVQGFDKFDNLEKCISIAIEKAYNDTKRTLKGIGSSTDKKVKAFNELAIFFQEYFNGVAPESEKAFDDWHKKACEIWVKAFADADTDIGTYGKAQKIVNMTFKYIYCFKYEIGQEEHFKYCHMPLDSYILEWFYRILKNQKDSITKDNMSSWSGISSYEESKDLDQNGKYPYMYYQNKIRFFLETQGHALSPLQAEFYVWTLMKKHLAAEAFYRAYFDDIEKDFIYKSLEDKIITIKELLA